MNPDLFRRLSSLAFAFIYALFAFVIDSRRPDISLLFCFFSVFLLGIWLTSTITWRYDQASAKLIDSQRRLLEIYRARMAVLDKRLDKCDDGDWWKEN